MKNYNHQSKARLYTYGGYEAAMIQSRLAEVEISRQQNQVSFLAWISLTVLLMSLFLAGYSISQIKLDNLQHNNHNSDTMHTDTVKEEPRVKIMNIEARGLSDHFNVDIHLVDKIISAAKKDNVDPYLIISIINVESTFNPNAVSHKGAKGLMQLMPIHSSNGEDLFDIDTNLSIGISFIKERLKRYNGDLEKALRYYNGGWRRMDHPSTHKYYKKVVKHYGKLRQLQTQDTL